MRKKPVFIMIILLSMMVFVGVSYANSVQSYTETSQLEKSNPFDFDVHYDEMVDLMEEKGLVDMAEHMQSIDREVMREMHDSMHGSNNSRSMMGGQGCH